jgi:hypothetical protein
LLLLIYYFKLDISSDNDNNEREGDPFRLVVEKSITDEVKKDRQQKKNQKKKK